MTLEEAYRHIKASYIHHSGERNAVFLPQAEKIAMECIQRMIDMEKAKQCNINHNMSFEAYYCYVQDLVTSANERLERAPNYGETNGYRIAELKSAIILEEQLLGYMTELKEAKRLLKAAVEDFAKLDRVNTKVRNCMIPDMDCADCPLSWDSVDDSVEPCHNWRYTNEVLALIGEEE